MKLFSFLQKMSIFFDHPDKADAAAEKFLQRAEQRILVNNHYTYDHVANLQYLGDTVTGNTFCIIF